MLKKFVMDTTFSSFEHEVDSNCFKHKFNSTPCTKLFADVEFKVGDEM